MTQVIGEGGVDDQIFEVRIIRHPLEKNSPPAPLQGFELWLISAHSQPSCPALCRASTPVNREAHRAETVGSAHILTFASRHRVDGRDKRGHDEVR
ncbi:hypothetical protein [Methylocystis sp. H4A]|uniref:hypothetical protein n=1 Tax=Methylocystis sp. H4A TaxID=2785788 RepID=UPI0018C1F1EB|nr:hypothetical protein [Methylocystis sp. H4A]